MEKTTEYIKVYYELKYGDPDKFPEYDLKFDCWYELYKRKFYEKRRSAQIKIIIEIIIQEIIKNDT